MYKLEVWQDPENLFSYTLQHPVRTFEIYKGINNIEAEHQNAEQGPDTLKSTASLTFGFFFSTSLILILIQKKPDGKVFPRTQINIFSPYCFQSEIWTVVNSTNQERGTNVIKIS